MKFTKKALVALAAVAALTASLALFGCSGSAEKAESSDAANNNAAAETEQTDQNGELTTIRVGATPAPHAEILTEVVAPLLKEKGYNLEVVEFTDYVLPNTSTEQGEIDANFFQHKPYLEQFNVENGTHLVDVAAVHFEPMAIYAGRTTSLDALPDGATVIVPNDTTNEARALLLLEQEGLIKLKDGAGITATTADIVENPKNLNIVEVEAASAPQMIDDGDVAIVNGNYAVDAKLEENGHAKLAEESADGTAAQAYENVVVVKEGNENNPAVVALVEAITDPSVSQYITDTYQGAVVPVF